MVMELMDHDLKSLMEDKSQMSRPFSIAEVKCLVQQLLAGTAYLHDQWVLHRDLKTSNILVGDWWGYAVGLCLWVLRGRGLPARPVGAAQRPRDVEYPGG